MRARPVSSMKPDPPWSCRAVSTTAQPPSLENTFAASERTARESSGSRATSSTRASMAKCRAFMRASCSRTTSRANKGRPNCRRVATCSIVRRMASRAVPQQPADISVRPHERMCWSIRAPCPASPTTRSSGRRTSSRSRLVVDEPLSPSFFSSRCTVKPGSPRSTRTTLCPRCAPPSPGVEMASVKRPAKPPFVTKIFSPDTTRCSPTVSPWVRRLERSLPAPASVVENAPIREPSASDGK